MSTTKSALFLTVTILLGSSAAETSFAQTPPSTTPAPPGTLALADSYIAGERYWEALQIAQSVLASTPDDAHARRIETDARAGLERVQKEKIARADERLTAGNLTDLERLELADTYYQNGRYVTAAELYAQLPESLRTRENRLRQARSLAWSDRLADAERLYHELSREGSDDEALLEHGRVLSWMGATKAATERLQPLYDRTRSEESLVALANAHAWRGNRERALTLLDAHLSEHPDAADAKRLRNDLAASNELRLEQLDRAIEAEPYNLALRVDRARVLIDMGRYGLARTDIDFVDDHADREPEGLAELRTTVSSGRADALALVRSRREGLDLSSPADAEAILETARAYTGLEEYDEAIELYEAYLRHHPDDLEARIAYARVLSWDERYSAAARVYSEILDEHDERLDLRLERAKVLAWDRQFVQAVDELEDLRSVDSHPQAHLYSDVPTDARFNLGQIYRWFGWNDHALDEQRAAVDMDAAYAPARKEIDLLRGLRPATLYDGTYTHAENSHGFEHDRFDLSVDRWTSQRTSWQLLLGRHEFADEDEEIGSFAVGAGARRRWSDNWSAFARAGANFYEEDLGTSPYWGLGAQWLPGLQSRVAIDYAHYDLVYDVFTVESLRNDPIDIDDFRLHYDHDTGGRWAWLADASTGFLSDDNQRTALHGLLSFRLLKEPYVAIKGDYRNLSYDFRSDRYWSPSDYQSLAGVLHVGDDIRQRLFWDVELKYGRSFEGEHESDLRAIEGRITVPINDAFDIVASYADGESGRIESVLGDPDFINYEQQRFYVGVRVKRKFQRHDRDGERPYYFDNRPIGESAVVPPEVQ